MKRRIIFVDDDQNILDGLKRMLHDQEEAWDMSFNTRPAQALEMMQSGNFDAAVIDVSMPGMTGIEMLSEIKSHPQTREMEVIILTGQQEQGLKREALSLGASDLLNKPVLKEDLLARLRNALRNKTLRDELAAQHNELEKQLIYAQRMELVNNLSEHAARALADVMSAIVWYSQLAEQMLESVSEVNNDVDLAKDNLRAIQNSGSRAKQLLSYVLSLGKQDPGPWQRTDLRQLVADALQVARALAPRGITIAHSAAEGELLVAGDQAQLFQLLLELTIFAIEQARPGNLLDFKLTTAPATDESAGSAAVLEITEGVGTAPERHRRHAAGIAALGATGGTAQEQRHAIAQRITKLHGGDLVVSTAPGSGITIVLRLPLADMGVAAGPRSATGTRGAW